MGRTGGGLCVVSRSPHGPFLPLLTDRGGFPLPDEKNNQLQKGASVTESSLINSRRAEDIDRALWLGRSLEMKMELMASAVTGLLVAGRTWTLPGLAR